MSSRLSADPGSHRSTRARRWVLGTVAVLVLFGAALVSMPVLMLMGSATLPTGADQASSCGPTAVAGGQNVSLDADQLRNAGTIVATGARMTVPGRGLVVAVATALQESMLRNMPNGDRDSVGLFQQRAGWGTFAQRTDPPTASTLFYTALLKVPGWQSMPLTQAAQAVQRSAFPLAYAKWEPLATSLVRSVVGNAPLGCVDLVAASLPTGAVGVMLRTALAQQGKPYVWGATGPDAFDCSGLVVYSWRQAGFRLSVRTAAQMADIAAPVAAGQERPGDLLFGEFGVRGTGAGHVMIVLRPGVAVQAPHTGDIVKISSYVADGTNWRLGRLPASALIPTGVAA